MTNDTQWTVLSRRTTLPKLGWLIRQLRDYGVEHRLNGESFHAPILEVNATQFDFAWKILGPVDGIRDEDELFTGSAKAWWVTDAAQDPEVAATIAAIGLVANKVRRSIAAGVHCVPEGASPYDCPFATGVIESCPANLWTVCRPMARLELFCLAVADVLPLEEARAVSVTESLVTAAKEQIKEDTGFMSLCHVFGAWMTNEALSGVISYSKKKPDKLIKLAMKGTTKIQGVVLPRAVDVNFTDVIAHGFDPGLN